MTYHDRCQKTRWQGMGGTPTTTQADTADTERVGFLLIPHFSMMAFFSAVEPLRIANRLAGRPLFRWSAYSPDGQPVEASNGMCLMVDGGLEALTNLPSLYICAGFTPERYASRPLLAALRALSRQGVTLGALDTGVHLLAKAGLLGGERVTMHWEAVAAFREEFPEVEVSDALFEVGRGRITCAGGTAALDMMLDIIARRHGVDLATAVSEQLIHASIRDRRAHQRMQISNRLGITDSRLLKIIDLMESNIEQPLETAALAEASCVSGRQLERLFRSHLGTTPGGYYLRLRLDRARQLLRQTDMAILDIAIATGFASASSLSRSYRNHFAVPPSRDRSESFAGGANTVIRPGQPVTA